MEVALQGHHSDYVFWENPAVADCWSRRDNALTTMGPSLLTPEGVGGRMSDSAMQEMFRCKMPSCIDCVIVTRLPNGRLAVLLTRRCAEESFGGCWWVQGGSMPACGHPMEFATTRVGRECGVPVEPQVLLGFYSTSAENKPQSTMQPCYAAFVEHEAIVAKMEADGNHDSIRLFTAECLASIPSREQHHYPMRVARLALANVPSHMI